jgi:cation-transporting ATPase I
VAPGHKVRLVGALQRAGHTVAMTGDGANDAGAIRLANVGIALGGHGATAALDAADMIVTDDRIETIVDAVLEGRAMWVSVRDAVAVLVGGNLGELGFSVAAGILGGASPLNARQLLLVNLLTDVAPAMAIALRPPPHTTAEALLHEGPEASLASPLTADIAWRAIVTGAGAGGAWLATRLRASAAESGTVALVALVGAQLGQTLATGGRSPLVVATSVGSLAALVGIVQTPGLSQLCGCTPLGPTGWTTGLTAAAAATGASVVVPWLWPEAKVWVEGHARTLQQAWPSHWRQLVGTPALVVGGS